MDVARKLISCYKNVLISPIDTFFDVVIDGERYKRIEQCRKNSTAVNAVLDNFEIWGHNFPRWKGESFDHTSELCDAILVYLAITNEGLINKTFRLEVDDDGLTRVTDNGTPVEVAIEWSDRDKMLDFLTDTYCNSKV